MSGEGELKYTNSRNLYGVRESVSYIGTFKNGKREGKGFMKWRDNTQFSGQWVNDHRYFGKINFLNGIVKPKPKNPPILGIRRLLEARPATRRRPSNSKRQ
jgi:hypothetical protein